MTDPHELDPLFAPEERRDVAQLSERLEQERPIPAPTFRGELRRRLLSGRQRQGLGAVRFVPWAVGYTSAGVVCLAVAAIGLVGIGPFAS
jgi:hypothetical protein